MSTTVSLVKGQPSQMRFSHACAITALAGGITITGVFALVSPDRAQAQAKRANVVMLMMDDVGWSDFGAYAGRGKALGHPTPNIDRVAKEGVTFTSWYG
jgi:arylsulfatase